MDLTVLAPLRLRDLVRNETEQYELLMRILNEHSDFGLLGSIFIVILFAIMGAMIFFP
jgi:hypothetical protein